MFKFNSSILVIKTAVSRSFFTAWSWFGLDLSTERSLCLISSAYSFVLLPPLLTISLPPVDSVIFVTMGSVTGTDARTKERDIATTAATDAYCMRYM